ncbi:hypothetical protein BBD42_26995 [Paenibacillus sp. BIHB 4019]|uniref:Uncharacterized protein n=1 Tax=Paenibacillus sp. BIHB 4019 TaxID=1870819 RepID=A0A1B2DPU6_9BACL|nr:hypothetical protein [Paenibacillus sp. BIHB 4019]ANY69731.1 hypothetical protein BBD42_26995 [Paenibacillus sp. BIHB 4019]
MKKQIDALEQGKANFAAKVSDLRASIEQKRDEKAKSDVLYRKMLLEDSSGTKPHSTTELSKVKQRSEALELEIQVESDRLKVLESGERETLLKFLPDIEKAYSQEVAKENAAIQKIEEEARALRAQLTIKIKEANAHYKKAYESLMDLNNVYHKLDLPQKDLRNPGVPSGPTLKQASGSVYMNGDRCVNPTETELNNAYVLGQLPEWIQHYEKTGELVTDEEARERGVKTEDRRSWTLGKLLGR